jgi:uncharacterized protein
MAPLSALTAIRPRNMCFGLSPKAPRLWHGGDVTKTVIFNGLSLYVPEGERLFADTVRALRDRITDPTLKAAVAGFLAQESLHSREHRAYNAVLAAQGFDATGVEAEFRARLDRLRRRYNLRRQLAITCALEHFTALVGAELLREPAYLAGAEDRFRRIWLWHAIEEVEHKAVAYDLYRHLFPGFIGYLVRVRVMACGTFVVDWTILVRIYCMLRELGCHQSIRVWWRVLNFLLLRPGLFRCPFAAYLRYYLPWFHPRQVKDGAALEAGLRELALLAGWPSP